MRIRRNKMLVYGAVGVVALLLVAGLIWFLTSNYYKEKMDAEKRTLVEQLQDKEIELLSYKRNLKSGYVAKKDIEAGTKLSLNDLEIVEFPERFVPEDIIVLEPEVLNKVIKIPVAKGTVITKNMVYEDGPLDPSLRWIETDYISLPYSISDGNVVDIRIVFPTGEDYIVVPKKKIDTADIEHQVMFFKGTSEELHLLSSALVDAYINNAELYAIRYVEAEMQDKPIVTYMPNVDVLRVMLADPMVVERARWEVGEQIREGLDRRMEEKGASTMTRVRAQLPSNSRVFNNKRNTGAIQIINESSRNDFDRDGPSDIDNPVSDPINSPSPEPSADEGFYDRVEFGESVNEDFSNDFPNDFEEEQEEPIIDDPLGGSE